MYSLVISISVIFLLNIYIFVKPISAYYKAFRKYSEYRNRASLWWQYTVMNLQSSRALVLVILAIVYYLFAISSVKLLVIVNIIGLLALLDFRWIALQYHHIRKLSVRAKDQPMSINWVNDWLLQMIQYFLRHYFAPLFYFMIGGLPLALLYSFISIRYRGSKTVDYWLYLPTRVYWLVLVLGLWFFSQGMNVKSDWNFKERNVTGTLNGTWIESLMAGMLGIQLKYYYHGKLIEIGKEQRQIDMHEVKSIFYVLSLVPFVFIFLY